MTSAKGIVAVTYFLLINDTKSGKSKNVSQEVGTGLQGKLSRNMDKTKEMSATIKLEVTERNIMDPPATAINVCKYNDFKLFPVARSDKNSTFLLSFH